MEKYSIREEFGKQADDIADAAEEVEQAQETEPESGGFLSEVLGQGDDG
ncbi:MAG: hypothetical protein LBR58_10840 [Propionibacteriaceae bacterium]|nr:hypothetical protein [Propionibacteriaceae bacterium]